MRRIVSICVATVGLAVLAGCSGGGAYELDQQVSMTMTVTLSGVDENGFLGVDNTCNGASKAPTVSWSDAPEGTESIVLLFEDIDFEGDEGATFAHWVVYALPPDTTGLDGPLPSGTLMGHNGSDQVRYSAPCPSAGDPAHTVVLTIYALDSETKISGAESRDSVLKAIDGIILAAGQATAEVQ